MSETTSKRRLEWSVFLFLLLNPFAAVVGLGVAAWMGILWNPGIWIFAFVYAIAANLSITAGYHRLFSHRSYEAHPLVQWFVALVGASAFEGSILKWSSDHRRHHGEVDTDGDPYSIQKGFWHAHMGWLLWKDSVDLPIEKVADLQKNPRVMFQHRYYAWLATLMGFLVPMAVGAFFGSAFVGLIVGGSLRIFLNQQSTFFVNSLCHTLGSQTYSKTVSARDSFFVALLTHGEGYHNFHHTFQIDYRNGIKWYQWDPTKWTINSLRWMGLATKLRTVSPSEILKARLQTEGLRLTHSGFSQERIEQMRLKVLEAQARWRKMKEEYVLLKRQAREAGEAKMRELKFELTLAKREFRAALAEWRFTLRAAPARARI
ncbi:MAG: fatty acid desaturase [Bdellovibrionaceae bacterium]|nr:fatty acid desaturase [Pseudobdellovibrionaceae bacterium]